MTEPLAYYNDNNPDAAIVLKGQIADGVIAPGVVDTRSIKDVQPDDLRPYSQCHFFAGGGLWSVAARLAGWPDGRPLWTASCPCQPFAIGGKGAGTDDPRHLWPDLFRLARAGRPPVLLGEQVARPAGYDWLDGVRADLEGEDYATRAVDIPACAVNAKQVRERLYWLAVANSYSRDCVRRDRAVQVGRLQVAGEAAPESHASRAERGSEPPVSILAYDVPGRVGLVSLAGNAIVPALAAEVIAAVMEAFDERLAA